METDRSVAIHQPAFLPWLGFFDKIIRSDIFVILDSVQFPKKGGYWANRVKILINGAERWLTVPIVRSYNGTRLIKEMEINNSTAWREKSTKTIEINYQKAPFFNDVFPFIKELIFERSASLCEYNIINLKRICALLDIKTDKIILSSLLSHEGTATDLLISIIKLTGAGTYMYGRGAAKYQENEKFDKAGIKLFYQNYEHPEYPQFNSRVFVPGLSIIDALMNCGVEGARKLLKTF